MKSKYLSLAVLTIIAALTLLAADTLFAGGNSAGAQSSAPHILVEPQDQFTHVDQPTVFTAKADSELVTYQWLHNGKILPGETNQALTFAKTCINDVGLYSCNIAKAEAVTPTRAASLLVYVNHIDPATGIDPMTIYTTATGTGGSNGACPGHYTGIAVYSKTIANGWGWAPDTNTTVHTATDTNRTSTKVEYNGKIGTRDCAQTTVTVPPAGTNTVYRFSVYFTNNVPTNPYALTLDGFNP